MMRSNGSLWIGGIVHKGTRCSTTTKRHGCREGISSKRLLKTGRQCVEIIRDANLALQGDGRRIGFGCSCRMIVTSGRPARQIMNDLPPLASSTRAGRLFAAWRATEKTEDATRFRRVGIPSRNVRLGLRGTEWNRPRNRCRHLRFSRDFEAQRRS